MPKTHGMTGTTEYKSWHAMRMRCQCPHPIPFNGYGKRGISVCERWHKFENFFADMGYKPTPRHSIDRIDNNKGYSPDNCKWSTRSEQQRNKRPIKNTKSGITGVCKQYNDWVAYIYVNNKRIYLGRSNDINEAARLRKEGEKKYW